jgi:hypothetical protein
MLDAEQKEISVNAKRGLPGCMSMALLKADSMLVLPDSSIDTEHEYMKILKR